MCCAGNHSAATLASVYYQPGYPKGHGPGKLIDQIKVLRSTYLVKLKNLARWNGKTMVQVNMQDRVQVW